MRYARDLFRIERRIAAEDRKSPRLQIAPICAILKVQGRERERRVSRMSTNAISFATGKQFAATKQSKAAGNVSFATGKQSK
jgi:hypothetical protein